MTSIKNKSNLSKAILLCSYSCFPFFQLLAPHKCFCEKSNGGVTRNSVLCGSEKAVYKVDECASDEWCVGPEDFNEGVNTTIYKALCVKGKFVLIEFLLHFIYPRIYFQSRYDYLSLPHSTSFLWKR